MMYYTHEVARAMIAPWRWGSKVMVDSLQKPGNLLSRLPGSASLRAGNEIFRDLTRRYPKPGFNLRSTVCDGAIVEVSESVVKRKPFAQLKTSGVLLHVPPTRNCSLWCLCPDISRHCSGERLKSYCRITMFTSRTGAMPVWCRSQRALFDSRITSITLSIFSTTSGRTPTSWLFASLWCRPWPQLPSCLRRVIQLPPDHDANGRTD